MTSGTIDNRIGTILLLQQRILILWPKSIGVSSDGTVLKMLDYKGSTSIVSSVSGERKLLW
jgi:hypothetical protein